MNCRGNHSNYSVRQNLAGSASCVHDPATSTSSQVLAPHYSNAQRSGFSVGFATSVQTTAIARIPSTSVHCSVRANSVHSSTERILGKSSDRSTTRYDWSQIEKSRDCSNPIAKTHDYSSARNSYHSNVRIPDCWNATPHG